MGWPFNGTRRWYLLNRGRHPDTEDYVATLIRRQAELHHLIFAHGISVIMAPGFGEELLARGTDYTRLVLGSLLRLAEDPVYQEMFACGVRIRFYGDFGEVLDTPTFRPILQECARLTYDTASGDGPLLLIGLFADAPYPTLARLSVEIAARRGRPPDRRELIEGYYGLYVPDLSLYLGFAQPALFDVPLVATGQEDLYTTLTPSPDLTEVQLREILYDHLVTRRTPDPDYETLSAEARVTLTEYNERYSGITLGVGHIDPTTRLWTPLLPDNPNDK
jgi:adenosine tuberculosinyltransferase